MLTAERGSGVGECPPVIVMELPADCSASSQEVQLKTLSDKHREDANGEVRTVTGNSKKENFNKNAIHR